LVDADDGIFWMCLKDFKVFFISMHVGMYDERFKFTFVKKREPALKKENADTLLVTPTKIGDEEIDIPDFHVF
jgi:hypothetical protein